MQTGEGAAMKAMKIGQTDAGDEAMAAMKATKAAWNSGGDVGCHARNQSDVAHEGHEGSEGNDAMAVKSTRPSVREMAEQRFKSPFYGWLHAAIRGTCPPGVSPEQEDPFTTRAERKIMAVQLKEIYLGHLEDWERKRRDAEADEGNDGHQGHAVSGSNTTDKGNDAHDGHGGKECTGCFGSNEGHEGSDNDEDSLLTLLLSS